jgi:hypothetical protein
MYSPHVIFTGGWKILSSEVLQTTFVEWRMVEEKPL